MPDLLADETPSPVPAEKSDAELLREAEEETPETPEPNTRDVDELLKQSEASQAAFLRGAIPKVVFQHAMEGDETPAI